MLQFVHLFGCTVDSSDVRKLVFSLIYWIGTVLFHLSNLQLETLYGSMQVVCSHPILYVSIKIDPAWIQTGNESQCGFGQNHFQSVQSHLLHEQNQKVVWTGKHTAGLDLLQTSAHGSLQGCSQAQSFPGPAATGREPQTGRLHSIKMWFWNHSFYICWYPTEKWWKQRICSTSPNPAFH